VGYTPVRRLGRGGMGVVDLGVATDGRQVALKRLPLHGSAEEMTAARLRIRREADVLRRLDHPAIVRLLDVVDDGDDVVLVMPYLDGGTLAERVAARGPLAPAEVTRLSTALLDALAAAHRAGVVHRDIKPGNVMFDGDGRAYLADFGVAISRDSTPGLTGTGLVIGTPGFMAPEQARGEPATAASDVFSLGATLAFAATGRGPYGSGEAASLMHRAARGKVASLPRTLPSALRHTIEAMLERRPERRPSAAALRRGPNGTVARTAMWQVRARRRVPAALAVAAALVVIAAGGAWLISRDGDGEAAAALAADPTTTTMPCLPDHADFDGDPANGCEAAPTGPADGAELVDRKPIEANLVPEDDVDTYIVAVSDGFQALCNGTFEITLTAPPLVGQKVEVFDGDELLGEARSLDGQPGTVELEESSCGGDDSTELEIVVSTVTGHTADPYTLERSGSF